MRTPLLLVLPLIWSCGDKALDEETGPEPVTGCAASSAELAACTDGEAYQADLVFIAQERPPGSEHHQAVQDLCAERFAALGLEVERHAFSSGTNVTGRLEGRSLPDEQVLITAHYDHIEGCPGADDNGSGVAGVLEAARLLSMGRYERSVVFACWDQEETGLRGARAWAEEAKQRGDTITAVFNFEMIGYLDASPDSQSFPTGLEYIFPEAFEMAEENQFRGDFLAVIGDEDSAGAMEAMATHAEAVELKLLLLELLDEQTTSSYLSDLRRSDHAPFWDLGYPAMMLTDTSEFRYAAYHCRDGDDVVENLDQDFARKNIATTVGAAADVAGLMVD
jgi:Zn-dependent M28 family amino/carboxypeptidase